MKSKTTLLIIAAVIIIAALAVYFFVFYEPGQNIAPIGQATPTASPTATATPVVSGGKIVCSDPTCLATNFLACAPAELTLSDPSSNTSVLVSVLGTEDNKCHYKMDVAGHGIECFFAKENLNTNVLGQMFGNQMGQDQIVNDSCKEF